MSVLAISITTVALAEIGDKTQLLSLLLASRYRKPIPIIAAIFLATIANHALAAWLGVVVADYLSPEVLKWVLVVSFVAMAAWVLIPDKLDDDEQISNRAFIHCEFYCFLRCGDWRQDSDCNFYLGCAIRRCIELGDSWYHDRHVACQCSRGFNRQAIGG